MSSTAWRNVSKFPLSQESSGPHSLVYRSVPCTFHYNLWRPGLDGTQVHKTEKKSEIVLIMHRSCLSWWSKAFPKKTYNQLGRCLSHKELDRKVNDLAPPSEFEETDSAPPAKGTALAVELRTCPGSSEMPQLCRQERPLATVLQGHSVPSKREPLEKQPQQFSARREHQFTNLLDDLQSLGLEGSVLHIAGW